MNDLVQRFVRGGLRVHLLGVAGSGMSGLAGLLIEVGHQVSGTDRVTTIETGRLEGLGLEFHLEPDLGPVRAADLVIRSSAIGPDHPGHVEAVHWQRPLWRRAEALARLMERRRGIVIAGTHGKTTTSAMVAHVLRCGGLRPSHYVGAEIPVLGTNAHWDREGEHFVAEGDESDGTLRHYHPEHSVLLNIEAEHLDFYRDLAEIEAVFRQLVEQTRRCVFYCADDPAASRLCASRPEAVSFGMAPGAHYRCVSPRDGVMTCRFAVEIRGRGCGEIELAVPGRHNASNAMAAVAVAAELGVDLDVIRRALLTFRAARRRMELKHQGPEFTVLDDYGHHPTEIRATLSAARPLAHGRLRVIFQPHRYTRTKALRDDFGRAFGDADEVWVTDIYPAGERAIDGVGGGMIVDAMREAGHPAAHCAPAPVDARRHAGNAMRPGDLLLTLGAGDIHEQGAIAAAHLRLLEAMRSAMGAGALRLYEPLHLHTTLRVGGPAQFWAEPETEAGLSALVRFCAELGLPVTVVGRGSNLLVRDGGVRGLVLHLAGVEFQKLEVRGRRIEAGAGVRLKRLCGAARAARLAGFEWMEGIPGSVGGALRMNAGAMGRQTFSMVESVRMLGPEGEVMTREPAELGVGYRSAAGLDRSIALSAVFVGREAPEAEIERTIGEAAARRRRTQPVASSAGCFFRNPDGCSAGRLVEELGFKGVREGGARVSDVHANFIVNERGASAAQILTLVERIRREARMRRGIELELEVCVIGEEMGGGEPL